MRPRAVYAEKHTIGDAGPAGVFSSTVKTDLQQKEKTKINIGVTINQLNQSTD